MTKCSFNLDSCAYCVSYTRCLLRDMYLNVSKNNIVEENKDSTKVLGEIQKVIPLIENNDFRTAGENTCLIKDKLDEMDKTIQEIKDVISNDKQNRKKKLWGEK